MSIIRLTDRKLRDARFRKNEEALLEVIFEEGGMKLSIGEIAKRIGVSRTTVHRHHRAMHEIEEDYERYILGKYIKLVKEIKARGNVELRRLYYEMVIFILQNKKIFDMFIKRKNLRVVGEMIGILKFEVQLPSNSERVFRVYAGEVVGLIMDWGLEGFKETEIVGLLNNIVYTTDMVRKRFSLIEN